MARQLTDSGEAFRLKLVREVSGYVSYMGPYATLGAARGQRTREKRYRPTGYTITVERSTVEWEEVPE